MDDASKYYDHDAIWAKRIEQGQNVWGRHSLRVYGEVLELISRFCSKPIPKLLDVGCGAGAFGKVATEKGLTYTGVDASQVAIELGKRVHAAVNLMCIDFALPLVRDLEAYDVVVAINSLHCLTETTHRTKFLQNMFLCLNPGGLVIVTTMCGPVSQHITAQPVRAYLDPDRIKAELQESGFGIGLFEHYEPANEYAKIPNLILVAKRSD